MTLFGCARAIRAVRIAAWVLKGKARAMQSEIRVANKTRFIAFFPFSQPVPNVSHAYGHCRHYDTWTSSQVIRQITCGPYR